ncbi:MULTISPECIES: type I restriction-modification system subunit M [Vibrio harveyi group]|uniref:class I SAM-dependent DNA methyltransferase n=1 Tax=Vibrio harveyi group TaxID=717610 RepID=UPI00215D4661|nr:MULTISPECIES: class I SAM-dependent DNA methyltransferase [Vibrio harveyi group]EIZ1548375.1 type I restriction-modification system subunit M [Vibrio parahaemolyticus]ELP3325820.1 type I restriction-modification system subunit M [Vibrio alginolyticus]MCR9488315.1 type I restriction-modification system subunit M [Vibrio alginolyticus]MCR9547369.1 type I restriction-modification system subunit M [Vibrio antiquarius]MCR9572857.1 type I restriction-modification system subunit M [Vibrio alginoly
MNEQEQLFLKELESKLWTAADKLRASLDASQYKHAVLGLIFVKYVSDAFTLRQEELKQDFANPDHEYFLDPEGYTAEELEQEIAIELEQRDYYKEKNVFWLPTESRWKFLQDNGPLVIGGAELEIDGKTKKITSVGHLIDNALEGIERDNQKLKGVLNKHYASLKIDQAKLNELINLIATIPFNHKSLNSKDILGHIYEYFLGQFALAEGKKGGQFYTPASIVSLIVEMIEPFEGRVYDPAMGSGGFFVQSEKFIERRANQKEIDPLTQKQRISIYGQEYNYTTWQLAAMNMAIRGLDYDFGKEPASTYTNDQHPDLRADFIMANPPFNMKEWNTGVDDNDPRWVYGTPPSGNANFAWMQHMLYHLAPDGSQALLLANGSMSSTTNNEGEIRAALVENDLVECMVALPGQLFTNTQIPACIWFLTKNKTARTDKAGRKLRDRKGEVLFIDARNLGYMKDRVLRDFTRDDIQKVADLYHAWKTGVEVNGIAYEDQAGFCKSATLEEITKHDFVLTPGRYVGATEELDDGIPFSEKMATLTSKLSEQFAESATLEAEIKKNLAGLGYEL